MKRNFTRIQMEQIIAETKYSMLIHGKPGIGKTTLVRKYYPRTCSAEDIVTAYTHGGFDKMISLLTIQLEYQKAVIVIDDLGSEKNTINQWGTQVYPLVEALRWLDDEFKKRNALNKETRLIITTNYNLDELGNKYGDRTVERIVDHVSSVILNDTNLRISNHDKLNTDLGAWVEENI